MGARGLVTAVRRKAQVDDLLCEWPSPATVLIDFYAFFYYLLDTFVEGTNAYLNTHVRQLCQQAQRLLMLMGRSGLKAEFVIDGPPGSGSRESFEAKLPTWQERRRALYQELQSLVVSGAKRGGPMNRPLLKAEVSLREHLEKQKYIFHYGRGEADELIDELSEKRADVWCVMSNDSDMLLMQHTKTMLFQMANETPFFQELVSRVRTGSPNEQPAADCRLPRCTPEIVASLLEIPSRDLAALSMLLGNDYTKNLTSGFPGGVTAACRHINRKNPTTFVADKDQHYGVYPFEETSLLYRQAFTDALRFYGVLPRLPVSAQWPMAERCVPELASAVKNGVLMYDVTPGPTASPFVPEISLPLRKRLYDVLCAGTRDTVLEWWAAGTDANRKKKIKLSPPAYTLSEIGSWSLQRRQDEYLRFTGAPKHFDIAFASLALFLARFPTNKLGWAFVLSACILISESDHTGKLPEEMLRCLPAKQPEAPITGEVLLAGTLIQDYFTNLSWCSKLFCLPSSPSDYFLDLHHVSGIIAAKKQYRTAAPMVQESCVALKTMGQSLLDTWSRWEAA